MKFINLVSQSVLFLTIFLFLFNKVEIGKEKKLFIIYINFALLSEIVSVSTGLNNINNIWLAHLYFPVEYFLFYLILLQWTVRYMKYWITVGVFIGAYIVLDYFFLTDFSKHSIIALSLQNSFFFIFSASMLIEITTRNFIPFYKDERFYIATGIFIYSSLTSLMYLFYNFFNILFPFYIVSIAGATLNLFFTFAMVLYYKKRKMLAEALK